METYFNNCNPITNGELYFFNSIKKDIKLIFDVGCRYDSEFLDFNGIVHYFDPNETSIDILKTKLTTNKESYYNKFGLGEENKKLFYYPAYQSFYDRVNSCKKSDDENKIEFIIKKGVDYINENKINNIDFLKIDTEGYEFNVIKGLEDKLNIIDIIQFEYGGTYLDSGVKLIDVINYLKSYNFTNFSYLDTNSLIRIKDFTDHYNYCNIVCFRQK
jgi:FkbM family methyltransferase